MKVVRNISFHAGRLPRGAASILEPTGCRSEDAEVVSFTIGDATTIRVYLHLEEGDPRIGRVFELLQHHGIKSDSYADYEFTEEDRQSAPLLIMSPDFDAYVEAGASEGTRYDLTAICPNCGMGAQLDPPLYISRAHLPILRKHRAIGCTNSGILADGGMVKKLRDNNVTGIAGFGEVYARMKNGGQSLVAREQIFIGHTLPPQAPGSQLDREKACPLCYRGNMSFLQPGPFRTVYRRKDLNDIRDMNLTWEWYGTLRVHEDPRRILVPYRKNLVTPKVMNIFREAGVTTFEWTPIFVED